MYRHIDGSDCRLREGLNDINVGLIRDATNGTITRSAVQGCDGVAVWEGKTGVNSPSVTLST